MAFSSGSRMRPLLDVLLQAGRSLRHDRGFALTSVVTIALGVAFPTAMLTVVDGVLLRPLPYPDADRIVRVWSAHPERGLPFFSVSAPDALDWEQQAKTFEAMGAFEAPQALPWMAAGSADQMLVSAAAPSVFEVLGVAPQLGRAPRADDGPAALVLGHALWQRSFGGDPGVIGRTLTIDGRARVVTGVMPPRFAIPGSAAEAWTPLSLPAGEDRSRRYLRLLARVRAGHAPDSVRADLQTVADRLQAQYPATNAGWSVTVRSLPEVVVGPDVREGLLILLGVVGFVLLIACANVAHLLLARGAARRHELSIRSALGASRGRLLGQLLAESAVLGIVGGTLGLLLAAWMIAGLRAGAAGSLPRLDEIRVDGHVMAFAAGVSLLAVALFGLLPSLQISRADAGAALVHEGRGAIGSRRSRLRGALVGIEVALAVVASTGSLLMLRSLVQLQKVDPGFDASGVVAVPLVASEGDPGAGASTVAFYEAVLSRVRALPGVEQASLVSAAPFYGRNSANVVRAEGQPTPIAQAPDADYRVVSPGYFATLRIPIVRGRDLEPRDGADAAVIGESLARRLWPGQDPLGRRFRVGSVETRPWVTVVGLAGDALYRDLGAPDRRPMFYLPHAWKIERGMTLVVRTTLPPATLAPVLREAVWSVDKSVPVPTVRSLDDVLTEALADRRFNASLFTWFAALAVVLSAVGVHGVVAHFVTLRRPEIGIRMALGATPRSIALFVVRRGGFAAVVGLAAGLAGAWALAPALRAQLYAIRPADPGTLAGVAAMFALVIAATAWVPVRRAQGVDPARILREG